MQTSFFRAADSRALIERLIRDGVIAKHVSSVVIVAECGKALKIVARHVGNSRTIDAVSEIIAASPSPVAYQVGQEVKR